MTDYNDDMNNSNENVSANENANTNVSASANTSENANVNTSENASANANAEAHSANAQYTQNQYTQSQPTQNQYTQSQPTQNQYTQQYTQNQYTQGQYTQNQYAQGQYTQGQYTQTQSAAQSWQAQSTNEPKKKNKKSGISGRVAALVICCCLICSAVFGFAGVAIGYNYLNGQKQADNGQISDGTNSEDIQSGKPGSSTDKNDTSVSDGSSSDKAGVIYQTVEGGSASLGENDIAAIVYGISGNSVVEITTEQVTTNSFIGQYITEGAGSGVIITENGYIVTNNHVVSGASTVTVRTADGESYPAEIIGADDVTDIAVIKIDASGLTPAVVGNSSDLVVGQRVVAIGNPLGTLGGTVTDGIISALDREITIDGQTMRLLQTNAAINPGNSGGGLFNSNGELVAIVNAKSSGSGIEGLGFAIPVDNIKEIINQLIENGYISGRPQLGISYIEVLSTQDYWKYIQTEIGNYITDYGVYVVTSDSDALKLGDRIVAIEDSNVSTASDLKSKLAEYKVGDEVTLTVVRSERMTDVKITLTERLPDTVNETAETN